MSRSYSRAVNVSPYPFERWSRMRPDDVVRVRRVARAVPSGSLVGMCGVLGELLGARVTLTPGPIYTCDPGALAESLAESLVAVVLRPPGPERPLVVELAPDFALTLVDRLLGGDGSQVGDAVGGLTELECGVVAYAAARVLGGAQRPWTVAGVITTRLALLGTLGDEGSAAWTAELAWSSTNETSIHRTSVRVWVPDGTRWSEAPRDRRWAHLPMVLVADGGDATLEASELLTLKGGDVLLLDDVWWRRERSLRLRIVGALATTWWARATDGALEVERIELGSGAGATSSGVGRTKMSEETATLKALGDAPVEVSVELARIRLTLAELQALRVGEIVVSGAPIGEHVRLRVGDVIIGEGELVEVDGQIGVRLVVIDAE